MPGIFRLERICEFRKLVFANAVLKTSREQARAYTAFSDKPWPEIDPPRPLISRFSHASEFLYRDWQLVTWLNVPYNLTTVAGRRNNLPFCRNWVLKRRNEAWWVPLVLQAHQHPTMGLHKLDYSAHAWSEFASTRIKIGQFICY